MRLLAASFAVLAACSPAPAAAAPLFYSDHDAFLAATTNRVEDHFDAAPWFETNHPGPVANLATTWSAASTLRSTSVFARSGTLALSDLDANTNDVPDVLTATLPAGTTAAGLWARSGQSWVQAEFSALAADDSVILSVSGWITDQYGFFGITHDAPIHRIRIGALRLSNDDFMVDDFVRGASVPTVPEPATLLLTLPGVGALLVRRRGTGGGPGPA